MARLSKVNPFKHDTRNDKKRKSRHADCYVEERRTLDALMQGNYSAPIVDHQPPQAELDNNYSDGYEAHQELNSGDESTAQVDTNTVLSGWSSIPWNVTSTSNGIQSSQPRYPLLDPSFIAAARARDRDIDGQILANNWNKAMSKLFTSYLWLREKTNNWTTESSFKDFTARFCKCAQTAQRKVAWIDLVDLTGQQRVKFQYCDCMPRCVQVLANGFLASSPLEPSAAFSMRLLAYHNYAWHHSNVRMKPFAETQRVFSEERSEFLWNRNMTGPRDLGQCLTKAVWLYRELLVMGLDLVQATLRLTDTQKLAYGTCPACFGPSSGTGLYQLPSVLHRLILSLDGNFQLRHHKRAGRQSTPLVTPDIFVQPSELEGVKEYITQQERLNKITKKADKCADSHKAGNDNRNETTWKACDDTGVMGSCCWHDSVVFLANIHGTGENRALPLTILKRFLASVGEDRPVGVLYDLGCSLDKYIDLRKIWQESRHRVKFGTSVFHAYVHEWPCQVKYNPRYQQGWGLSDGESLERLWSSLSPLVSPLRYATRNNRLAALSHRCRYRNQQSNIKLAAWLRKKFEQALVRRDLEKTVISELVQTTNPNTPGQSKYTIAFFRSQWDDQVRVALEKNDTDDHQKRMNEFLDNEEVLESYRARMARGKWLTTLAKSNEMFQAIEERGKAQRALVASLGTDYAALRGQCQSELSLLTLLWKAKSDLYALAVTVRAEREPIVTTDAGNRLGTRLKEKIMGAINRRKNPVERVIKLFNERRRAYLQKVDASRLLLPENQDLTLAEFRAMDLTDPLWNDNHFYHARAPWALDPNVRRGIKSVLFLNRVEEEFELLTQELDRSITWACEYRTSLTSAIRHIDLEAEEPVNPDNKFAAILPSFPSMKGKLRLLRSELVRHLEEHQRLMVTWSTDVEILWNKTRSHLTKNTHTWFDNIGPIKQQVFGSNRASIDDTVEQQTFDEEGGDQEEEEEEDEDEDGSLTGDDDINMEVIDDHVDGPGGPTE
ncbi:hypothetical protein Pst134EA_028881 [Puccinia striiformis f. sp. tritici]|uniref:hypothetical protein n=1 Tax=Puccinia striiformis f. sp. tritici TaxID=168172 RepID=UPI0020078F21|nr:hypothetical protein Pst134EA_028881 [Puccinia striiformis f. sp. tritici]KAH9446893.1 hypothetical protein Pst134EA_028881 [Puccinia striiformis f. sp. tritici]